MTTHKSYRHFTHPYLIAPTHPITVNLIGVGGTGSHVLSGLARLNHALLQLGHPGLQVTCFDPDTVSEANPGRQLFFSPEVGLHKAVALINRINRAYGTGWKAVPQRFHKGLGRLCHANLTISCVDEVKPRFAIADILQDNHPSSTGYHKLYWMDFGNDKTTGQVFLSTVGKISQPKSQQYQPVDHLPLPTDLYRELFITSASNTDSPSCSLAEALTRQDLFINSTLANAGVDLLWKQFRQGMIAHYGFFLNLQECTMHGIGLETIAHPMEPQPPERQRGTIPCTIAA
jgi:PRTRC genetic system ThiF family protein